MTKEQATEIKMRIEMLEQAAVLRANVERQYQEARAKLEAVIYEAERSGH